MVALPDLHSDIKRAKRAVGQTPVRSAGFVMPKGIVFCAGTAAIVAAIGLWLFPEDTSSALLVKLGLSTALALGGLALIALAAGPTRQSR